MGKARILILLIAVLAGGAAFYLVSTGTKPAEIVAAIPLENKAKMVKVLVADEDFAQGDILDANKTRWIKWPIGNVPDFYITETNQEFVEGLAQMRALRVIKKNEPIFMANTVRHGERGMLAAIMTPGMRAVTAKLTAEQTSGGFVLPGDRVDIFVSGTDPNGNAGETRTELLLSNVRVLAIDQIIAVEEENAILGRTVTIELAPEQVDVFLRARDTQTITLALRAIFEGSGEPITDRLRPDEVVIMRYGQG